MRNKLICKLPLICLVALMCFVMVPGKVYCQPSVPAGFIIVEFATDVNNPTCLAFPHSGSTFDSFLYVGSNTAPTDPYYGNPSKQAQDDFIFSLDSQGEPAVFVSMDGESDPVSLAFGPGVGGDFGNYLYISANNRDGYIWGDYGGAILRVDSSKTLTDFTPHHPASGTMYEPVGIAFGSGVGGFGTDLYVANSDDVPADIVTVNSSGIVSVFRDFNIGPQFVEFGPDGDFLYFSNYINETIMRVEHQATTPEFVASVPLPRGLQFDSNGYFGESLYVVSPNPINKIMRVIGETSETFASGFMRLAGGAMAFSPDGKSLFVADMDADKIYRICKSETYSCAGFEPPMDRLDPVTVKGKNRVIPFKAELLDVGGLPVTDESFPGDPPVIQVLFIPETGGATVDVTEDALSAGKGTEGNQFEFIGGKWQFNLKLRNYSAAGTYFVTMEPGSGCYLINETCEASFEVNER